MAGEIEKLKMHSPDLTQDNIAKIRAMFPGCVTEAQGEDGKLRLAVDFDQLRQELSDSIVEGPQERYHLNWPGKREALITANAPIAKTLRPARDESVDFDTTQNLFIEGDNLEALKLLQETYLGKVKMIYIDPPYNTGNDFVYDDDFSVSSAEFLTKSLQMDDDGNRMRANTETNGRYHSDWLSMAYARLKAARILLDTDGVICVSIDDTETQNMRKVLDEVFGEKNFVSTIVWQKRYVANVTAQNISDMHDFIHVYARDYQSFSANKWPLSEEQLKAYKNPDNDPRGLWRAQDLSASKPYQAGLFTIQRNGQEFSPPPNRYWRCNEEQFKKWDAEGRIWWGMAGDARPMLKSFINEKDATTTPHTWWDYSSSGHNKEATLELKALFDGSSPFDTPKPVRLLRRLLQTFASDGICMDFFAGSSSFADAVLNENAAGSTKYSFIQVQWPEVVKRRNEGLDSFGTISELSQERIRRAGQKILEGECHPDWNKDVGFRVLKIDSSNMADVFYTPNQTSQPDLLSRVDNIKPDRTVEDLLFQVLLDWGVDLTLPIRRETVQGKTVFFVADTALMACFDDGISEDLVKELAGHAPMRIVFKDTGFADDQTKINVRQIFKALSPSSEVKAI